MPCLEAVPRLILGGSHLSKIRFRAIWSGLLRVGVRATGLGQVRIYSSMVRVRVRVALDGEDEDGALLMVDGPPG